MNLALTDKVALVTGSSRGLGLASAQALAAEGARVCLCARGTETLGAAAETVRAAGAGDRVIAVTADLSTDEGIRAVVERTIEAFGGVDILVNNIGLGRGGTCSRRPTTTGRRRSITRCIPPSAPRASSCRRCGPAGAVSF